MHMLHNRRKAEIEILTTAKLRRKRQLLHPTTIESPWMSKEGPVSPLLDYLLDKISDFVNEYVDA